MISSALVSMVPMLQRRVGSVGVDTWCRVTRRALIRSGCCCSFPQLNTGGHPVYATLPWQIGWENCESDRWSFSFFITTLHGHPHGVFWGSISISWGWRFLCKDLTLADDNFHICSTWHLYLASVFSLMSVCCDSLASVSVLGQLR